jgi:anhydro-N-acetylmuramic acid kinase
MSDYAMKKFFDKGYDRDGENAAKGSIDQTLLKELEAHPFLLRTPPRSAWRLDFGEEYAEKMIQKHSHLKHEDVLATFCAFTAYAIVKSIKDNIPDLAGISTLIASGGGIRNKTIMRMLREALPGEIELKTSDAYGIPPQFKEAMKFATLGFATINQIANNVPACSGATQFTIMGKVCYAPRLAKALD